MTGMVVLDAWMGLLLEPLEIGMEEIPLDSRLYE